MNNEKVEKLIGNILFDLRQLEKIEKKEFFYQELGSLADITIDLTVYEDNSQYINIEPFSIYRITKLLTRINTRKIYIKIYS